MTAGAEVEQGSGLRASRLAWFVGAVLALGAFIELTQQLPVLGAWDARLLVAVVALRMSSMNGAVATISALGSEPVIVLVSVIGVILFLRAADGLAAAQLAAAAVGGRTLARVMKILVARPRPDSVLPIAAVPHSASYPSGHAVNAASVYITLALIAARALPLPGRLAVSCVTALVVALVMLSRVYLGVHYPTDVAGGLLLGLGWALLVKGACVIYSWRKALQRAIPGALLVSLIAPARPAAGYLWDVVPAHRRRAITLVGRGIGKRQECTIAHRPAPVPQPPAGRSTRSTGPA